MNTTTINVLLADDDEDDCRFFKEALDELPVKFNLIIVNDGIELMRFLNTKPVIPDALFLDLNMPRKNGLDCLTEIKANKNLFSFPVFIYSTSFDNDVMNLLHKKGAQHYIRKPGDFSKLKEVIHEALDTISIKDKKAVSKQKFIIQAS